jgi:hypothetical protein
LLVKQLLLKLATCLTLVRPQILSKTFAKQTGITVRPAENFVPLLLTIKIAKVASEAPVYVQLGVLVSQVSKVRDRGAT